MQQADIRRFLTDPATHGGVPVDVIETHASVIFLAGRNAYKMKRAVRYSYLDYTNPDTRRAYCQKEFRISSRTAPALYLGCIPVTRETGGDLAIDGRGVPMEWLVWMHRFEQHQLLDRIAQIDGIGDDLANQIADSVFRFHDQASAKPTTDIFSNMVRVSAQNIAELRRHSPDIFRPDDVDTLERAWADISATHEPLIRSRAASGAVLECHGDLHLKNIVVLDSGPTLFDAIEFDSKINCIDRLYDLAFLIMDLLHRGDRPAANRILNRYLARHGDYAGLPLMRYYLSLRAAIRAHTTASAESNDEKLATETGNYLQLAKTVLEPAKTVFLAIGGPSGSGKSTVAARLAPSIGLATGAIVLRSDMIRKRMFGLEPKTRLKKSGYDKAASDRVFAQMGEESKEVLNAGFPVICDAVFGEKHNLLPLTKVSNETGFTLKGFWLTAPREILLRRVKRRKKGASDADGRVVHEQLNHISPPAGWHILDATRSVTELCDLIKGNLVSAGGNGRKSS